MRASYSSFQAQMRSHQRLAAEVVPGLLLLLEQATLDDGLGGDAGVVGAGHPEGVEALHPPPSDEDVLERVIERMAEVQCTGDVGRRDHDAIGRPIARRVGVEVAPAQPQLVIATLGVLGIVLLGEVGGGHDWSDGDGPGFSAGRSPLSSKSRSQSTMCSVSSSTP